MSKRRRYCKECKYADLKTKACRHDDNLRKYLDIGKLKSVSICIRKKKYLDWNRDGYCTRFEERSVENENE